MYVIHYDMFILFLSMCYVRCLLYAICIIYHEFAPRLARRSQKQAAAGVGLYFSSMCESRVPRGRVNVVRAIAEH